ncbi:response regulator [Coraliomargarita sp. W4R53]
MKQIRDKFDDIRVIVMEDHGDLCQVLNRSITLAEGMCCVGHFNTAVDTLDAIPSLMPDVILLDLTMPDINGLGVLRRLKENWPEIRAIIFSGHVDDAYVRTAFERGAMGYVFKGDFNELIGAIQIVAGGEYFLSPRFNDDAVLRSQVTGTVESLESAHPERGSEHSGQL